MLLPLLLALAPTAAAHRPHHIAAIAPSSAEEYTAYLAVPASTPTAGVAYAWLLPSLTAALLTHSLPNATAQGRVVFCNGRALDLPMQLSYLHANLYNASLASAHLSPSGNFTLDEDDERQRKGGGARRLRPASKAVAGLVACRNTTAVAGGGDQLFWVWADGGGVGGVEGCVGVELWALPVDGDGAGAGEEL